ncbi:MAG: histidine kinase, partial [Bacteroidota bacterium]
MNDGQNIPIEWVLKRRVLTHVLFWGGGLLLFAMLAIWSPSYWWHQLLNYAILLPVQMVAAYLFVYYQLPKLLMQRRFLMFLLSLVVSTYLFSLIARLSVIYVLEPLTRTEFEQESVWEVLTDPVYLLFNYFPLVYIYTFLMWALKSFKSTYEERHRAAILEKEKAETELKFLKAQVQPHFLFNTLNSLYALTLTKSDTAPQVVLKLSELLDYMLYHVNERRVAFSRELKLLQDYIELEQLRYGD